MSKYDSATHGKRPWAIHPKGVVDADGWFLPFLCEDAGGDGRHLRDAVDAVNTLSSCERPEKLGELLKAIAGTTSSLQYEGFNDILAAFSALGYVAPEEKP